MTNTASSNTTPTRTRSGIAARALASAIAGAMLAVTGCAADLGPGETLGDREIIEYSAETLGEFKTDDGAQLTFAAEYEDGDESGDPVVTITELAPIGGRSYLDHFRARGATSLEAFLALAPAGAEPPALLLAAHEREAASLDRSAEVRDLPLTMSATFDSATCDSYAAFVNSLSSLQSEQTASSTQTHSLTFHNGGNVAAAMCNYDSDRVDYKYAQFCYEVTIQGSEFGLLLCDSKILVPDGHRVNKSWIGATTDRLVRAEKLANYSLTVSSYIGIGGIPPVE